MGLELNLPPILKGLFMSKVCNVCGKGPQVGYNVSHAHNRTKRRWLPNLQTIRANIDGIKKRIKVCTACIRTGRVVKAV